MDKKLKEYMAEIGRKGGHADKTGKRPDMKKGGEGWEKTWGKAARLKREIDKKGELKNEGK